MKRVGPFLFGLALSLSVPCGPAAAQDSIWLGSVEITKGMPEAKVLEAFGRMYFVSKAKGSSLPNDWVVVDKGKSGELIGTVSFQSGRVAFATSMWGAFGDNESIKLAKLIAGVLAPHASTPVPATVQVDRTRGPTLALESVIITIGSREIRLSTWESTEHGTRAEVQEHVRWPAGNR